MEGVGSLANHAPTIKNSETRVWGGEWGVGVCTILR